MVVVVVVVAVGGGATKKPTPRTTFGGGGGGAAASGGGTFVQTPWKQKNSPSEKSGTSRVAAEGYQAPQLSPSAHSDVDAQEPGNIALSASAVAVTVAVDAGVGVGADSASRAALLSPPSGSEGDSQRAEQLPTAPVVAEGIGDID